jgi:hypothetical protein
LNAGDETAAHKLLGDYFGDGADALMDILKNIPNASTNAAAQINPDQLAKDMFTKYGYDTAYPKTQNAINNAIKNLMDGTWASQQAMLELMNASGMSTDKAQTIIDDIQSHLSPTAPIPEPTPIEQDPKFQLAVKNAGEAAYNTFAKEMEDAKSEPWKKLDAQQKEDLRTAISNILTGQVDWEKIKPQIVNLAKEIWVPVR